MKKTKQAKVLALNAKGLKPKEIAVKAKCSLAYVYNTLSESRLNNQVKEQNAKADVLYKASRGRPRTRTISVAISNTSVKSSLGGDMVNHPPHYKSGGIETIDFIEAKSLDYHLGNVVKYVSRAGLKGNKKEDLLKAQWYLNRAISKLSEV